MADTATRPNLTVDVNLAHSQGKSPRQNARAVTHAARSAQAPQQQQQQAPQGGFSSDEDTYPSGNQQQQQRQQRQRYQGDESPDDEYEDGEDEDPRGAGGYANQASRQYTNQNGGYGNGRDQMQLEAEDGSEMMLQQDGLEDDEEEEEEEEEDDEDMEDDDDDELSSSPSIPDENIDFDLVYALHTFVATVEGQATVNKGNSLTLLDDSNSYWWLVRVLRTQEVGYIPAENIETPFERLARLNKHRNVDLTVATDDDHIQVPSKIHVSHLLKRREAKDRSGLSEHSGKLSALSRRRQGAPSGASPAPSDKPSVVFGPPQYVEHSGDEYDTEDEEDMGDDEDWEEGEDEEEDEDDGEELNDEQVRAQMDQGFDGSESTNAGGAAAVAKPNNDVAARRSLLAGMEPDDGMEWDAAEAERIQKQKQQRAAQGQTAQASQGRAPGTTYEEGVMQPHIQPQVKEDSARTQQQLGYGRAPLQGASSRPKDQMTRSASGRSLSSQTSSNGGEGAYLPSQVQAGRERSVSDLSQASSSNAYGRGSPMPAQERKLSKEHKRKSKNESIDAAEDVGDEKSNKKRSGVFSGLFSRNKDKKEGRKSGSFYGDDSTSTIQEESNLTRVASPPVVAGTSTGHGRTLQERDRAQQQAFTKQFLGESSAADSSATPTRRSVSDGSTPRAAKPRPGSLIGLSSTVPMLNVLRVFAGDDIECDATFKTVLLNETTSARDLVRQAMQRFRLGQGDYILTVKLEEGSERVLAADEKPLQVFDRIQAMTPDGPMIPSVKRSSVGSISSISSNLSLNPAIARVNEDFSDDHAVKFYIRLQPPINGNSGAAPQRAGQDFTSDLSASSQYGQAGLGDVTSRSSAGLSADGDPFAGSTDTGSPMARFSLRLVVFPGDLPDSMAFDPQTNALVPKEVLMDRGPGGVVPSTHIEQRFREKIISLPRNATVADAIEHGLDHFGIAEGVVDGGDDVEDRLDRRRSTQRVRYGLSVDVNKQGPASERPLAPNSKILDAYPSLPTFKAAAAANKRRSADSSMLLALAEEQLRPEDPIFVLRSVSSAHGTAAGGKNAKTVRSLSPTEGRLAERQDQRRQQEIATAKSALADTGPTSPTTPRSRQQEVIAAQRAAAQAGRVAVAGAQRNEVQGVDLYLENRDKIRSSRSMEGTVRYSYLPAAISGEEIDISAIVEDVLGDQTSVASQSPQDITAPSGSGLRPPISNLRAGSTTTINSFHSAPSTPLLTGPLGRDEVNFDFGPSPTSTTGPLTLNGKGKKGSIGSSNGHTAGQQSRDLLETFVRNPDTGEDVIEERVGQVLSRVPGGYTGSRSASGNTTPRGGAGGETRSVTPTGANQTTSSKATPTSMAAATVGAGAGLAAGALAAGTAGGALVGAAVVGGSVAAIGSLIGGSGEPKATSIPDEANSAKGLGELPPGPAAYIPSNDFGLDHLYTVVDAAMRRDPSRYTRIPKSAGTPIIGGSNILRSTNGSAADTASPSLGNSSSRTNSAMDETVLTLGPEKEISRPQVAGLFYTAPPFPSSSSSSSTDSSATGTAGGGGERRREYEKANREVEGMEDQLDGLLNQVLRIW